MVQYQVRSAQNGYIFQGTHDDEQVFATLDELLNHLLLMFEGRCEYFTGASYGRVLIEREATQQGTPRTAIHRDDCAINVGMLGECDCGAED